MANNNMYDGSKPRETEYFTLCEQFPQALPKELNITVYYLISEYKNKKVENGKESVVAVKQYIQSL